jgi:hypothetical protein
MVRARFKAMIFSGDSVATNGRADDRRDIVVLGHERSRNDDVEAGLAAALANPVSRAVDRSRVTAGPGPGSTRASAGPVPRQNVVRPASD